MAKVLLDKSKFHVLGQLVSQLRFVPPQTLLEQSLRAERLLRLIDPEKNYPYDFVCFKLTDYKPKEATAIDRPLPGRLLIADLAQFIGDVTSQVPVGFDQFDQPAVTVEELAEQAGVSVKTLCRWQKRGLPLRAFTSSDGRRRYAVHKSTWEWFVDRNEKLVARAAAFSRVTAPQRRWVVREARTLFSTRALSRHQIEKLLAEKIGRVPETVHYILARHDATAEPHERIFPLRRRIGEDQRLQIWQMVKSGTPVPILAHTFGRSESSIYRIIHKTRQEYWVTQTIEFIYSPEFDLPNASDLILPAAQITIEIQPDSRKHVEILTAVQERGLFRAYNYLKWQQSELINRYRQGRSVPAHILDRLEELGATVEETKRKLVLTNQALAINIARRHLSAGLSLDELISEGMIPLLKAIEKFDYTRGYKFSTYASWAVMKQFARAVPEYGRHQQQYVSVSEEDLERLLPGATEVDEAEAFIRSQAVQEALDGLDPRERHILANRFSLDREGEPLSLSQLGKSLGISKERVRQLETRAMEKMHHLLEPRLPT